MADERFADVTGRFSQGADVYRDILAPALLPHSRRLVEALPLAGARRVLDVGCGVGSLWPTIRAAAPGASIVGVDGAQGMISLAPRQGLRAVADCQRLPLGDAIADAAVMAFVLFLVPEPEKALREIARVLRAGGALALATWAEPPASAAVRAWEDVLAAHQIRRIEWPSTMPDERALAALLEDAGFRVERTWMDRLDWQPELGAFFALRVGMGKKRLEQLAPEQRAPCVAEAWRRLGSLPFAAFHDSTRMVCAVAHCG